MPGRQPEAAGVEVQDERQGRVYSVRLRRGGEVILSAGSVATPKLLVASGIGRRTVLDKLQVANSYLLENFYCPITSSFGKSVPDLPVSFLF